MRTFSCKNWIFRRAKRARRADFRMRRRACGSGFDRVRITKGDTRHDQPNTRSARALSIRIVCKGSNVMPLYRFRLTGEDQDRPFELPDDDAAWAHLVAPCKEMLTGMDENLPR